MTDEPPAPPSQPVRVSLIERVNRFYSRRPWLGCLGTVASVVGIPLAVYLAPSAAPRLMFKVSPSRSVVVAKSQIGGLRVLHGDQEIKGDVTAVQVSLWNEGRGPVRDGSVLEPVKIVTDPLTPIIAASVQQTKRPLTEVSLDASALTSGVVPIRFRILEHGDGALIQLVYSGPPTVEIRAVGALEGQRAIESVTSGTETIGASGLRRISLLFTTVFALFWILEIQKLVKTDIPSTEKPRPRESAEWRHCLSASAAH